MNNPSLFSLIYNDNERLITAIALECFKALCVDMGIDNIE